MSGQNFDRYRALQPVSRARYTSPMPPAPTSDWISYGPNFVPGISAIDMAIIPAGVRIFYECGRLSPGKC